MACFVFDSSCSCSACTVVVVIEVTVECGNSMYPVVSVSPSLILCEQTDSATSLGFVVEADDDILFETLKNH